jgi:hypothetical protein
VSDSDRLSRSGPFAKDRVDTGRMDAIGEALIKSLDVAHRQRRQA